MATHERRPRRAKGSKFLGKVSRGFAESGFLVTTTRTGRQKPFKPQLCEISTHSPMFDPSVEVSKFLRDALRKNVMNGPVRILTERIGEVANLSNPAEQMRSCAAILARKYGSVNQRLRNLSYQAGQRELSEHECWDVFRIVGGLGREPGRIFVPCGVGEAVREEPQPAEAPREGAGVGEAAALDRGCPDTDLPEPDFLDERGPIADEPDVALGEEENSDQDCEADDAGGSVGSGGEL